MASSILALELCVRTSPNDRVQADLRRLAGEAAPDSGFQRRWDLWNAAAASLLTCQDRWYRGCWDFFEETGKAESDFRMWVTGMLTREGSRREPSGASGAGGRYMTFTLAALLQRGTSAERELASVCAIPEAELWRSTSFVRILHGMKHLNFAAVQGDVMYLIPRDPDWALTTDDLALEKFAYLRTIA